MLAFLLAGEGTVASAITSRAQLPLLLNQAVVATGSSVDVAVETDTAFTATVFIGAALVPAEVAVETDTAMNVTLSVASNVSLSVSVAEETDTAFDLTVASSQTGTFPGLVYPGSETYPWSGYYFEVDVAEETDTAFDLTAVMKRLFPVSERSGNLLVPVSVADEEAFDPVTPT